METLEKLAKEAKEAKDRQVAAEKYFCERMATALNLKKGESFRLVNNQFWVVDCASMESLKSALAMFEPHETSQKIGHSKCSVVCSPYRIDMKNGFYDRKLKISLNLINNVLLWVSIDVKNLSVEFINKFIYRAERRLYDTETVYVNIPSHCESFKEFKVESFDFSGESVGWYGGDKTLSCADKTKEIINAITK